MDGGVKISVGRNLGALLCLMAVFTQALPVAAADPIPGVDVVVEKIPPGSVVARARTDRDGCLTFKALSLGRYSVADKQGNRALIDHTGGPAKWQLLRSQTGKESSWSLIDECKRF